MKHVSARKRTVVKSNQGILLPVLKQQEVQSAYKNFGEFGGRKTFVKGTENYSNSA